MSISHQATNTAGDGYAFLLMAGGFTFLTWAELAAGVCFACACAMISRHWYQEHDRREIWLTLLSAVMIAGFGGEIYLQWFGDDRPPVPVQFVMAGLGLCSRVIVTLIMKLLLRTEARSDEIVDKVIDKKLED